VNYLPKLLSSFDDQHLHAAFFKALKLAVKISAIALMFTVDLSAQTRISYQPTPIFSAVDVNDLLTDQDIPTGQKGFARDYIISVQKEDRLEITVNAKGFDTVLSLLDSKGEVIAENDDAAPEVTNSLIFFKVMKSGNYIIRVSSFGGSSGGKFILRVNKLQVIK
jgi:hypothetical protein